MTDCRLPIPIASMDAGFFWCRTATIPGITEEEAEGFLKRELSLERTMAIEHLVTEARAALFEAECPGVQPWMPAKRAMS
jgi:hypothetical protein